LNKTWPMNLDHLMRITVDGFRAVDDCSMAHLVR
jgi:hypothetical protein